VADVKRWRPWLSLRLVLVLITLFCAALACWRATKKYGIQDVHTYVSKRGIGMDASSDFPLIVGVSEIDGPAVVRTIPQRNAVITRRYYIWLFGPVLRLPYERDLSRR
jgi:hypothetical protein